MCNCNCGGAAANATNNLLAEIALSLKDIAASLSDIADAVLTEDDDDDDTGPTAPPTLPTADAILAVPTSGWGRIEAQPVHRHLVSNEPVHNRGLAQGTHGHYHGLAR